MRIPFFLAILINLFVAFNLVFAAEYSNAPSTGIYSQGSVFNVKVFALNNGAPGTVRLRMSTIVGDLSGFIK